MAADVPSMFAVSEELREAQLLLAEPHLLGPNDTMFIIDRLLLTPEARSIASRGHSPLRVFAAEPSPHQKIGVLQDQAGGRTDVLRCSVWTPVELSKLGFPALQSTLM